MRKTLIATLVLVALSGCAFAQLGSVLNRVRKANDAFTPWSPEQENAIGQASAAKMIHVMGLIEDPALNKYVQYVGNTVARQANRPVSYHFAILEAKTPDGRFTVSAFALPGGYVFVTKGALNHMTDEAQLAGVLAHEIAHVDGRHLEKAIQKKKAKGMAIEEGTSHIPGPSELKNIANNVISAALLEQVNPKDEDDADKKGTQFAAGAGYDPTGLKRFLEVLQQESQSGKVAPQDTKLWGATHPPISERIARLSTQTATASGGQTLPDRFKDGMADKPVLAGAAASSSTPAQTPAANASVTTPAQNNAPANNAVPSDSNAQQQQQQQQQQPAKKKKGLGGLIPH